jgi:hypothetical protein
MRGGPPHPRGHLRSGSAPRVRDPLADRRSRALRASEAAKREAHPSSRPESVAALVEAGTTERWQAALGLAGYAGLRLGEIRALTWADIDFEAGTLSVRRSLLPDGTAKAPKTEAGIRAVPLLPALRRLLVTWKLCSPYTEPGALVVATADGKAVSERNLRRRSRPRRMPPNSRVGRTASPGTRSATRSPLSWRLTSSCPRRRWHASPAIRTPALPCASMPATAATKPRLWTTFTAERPGREWARESGSRQVRASDAGGKRRKCPGTQRLFMALTPRGAPRHTVQPPCHAEGRGFESHHPLSFRPRLTWPSPAR